ncbi:MULTISPECIES: cytosine deaminase [Pseudanabaena]|uniref:Cytosine deaminase n=2 Tax=Pseudanabaena TaxID=1152 RepID=L8N7K4_9CYAN|nr:MULTISPECIES: cytosine deaminase [Pseudanabaena]ELS34213.1 Cytosine deaminase [Pseudanabaena biceps PCC 7429]MDG3493573.1 cytosine deaminase [Pseudanabaena catenata USMAC16]
MTANSLPAHYWIVNARIPNCFIDRSIREQNLDLPLTPTLERDQLFPCHLEIQHGKITGILPSVRISEIPTESLPIIDGKQGMITPCFADLHTHLDKGHTWERNPNLDGTFQGALKGIYRDCTEQGNWSYDDLYRRMEFGLKCSYAHGTKAIRTHLDCPPHQFQTTFQVFRELREKWKEKITLQAVSLVQLSYFDTKEGEQFADAIADLGGIMGGIAHMIPELDHYLDRILTLATERHLNLDFHADENNDPSSRTLHRIAEASLRHNFAAQIVCGHCCSLAVQDQETALETIALVKDARVGIVSLPMCNLYLQDRVAERTPRWRGVTLVRELDAAGVSVALSSDNCRDPFYGFGDHDLLQVFSMGTKISHLDTPYDNWIESVTSRPAALMGLDEVGLGIGQPADLVLFKARCYSELLSRPQNDRLVLRNGIAIDTTLPDYAELDDLL